MVSGAERSAGRWSKQHMGEGQIRRSKHLILAIVFVLNIVEKSRIGL